ncbi:hypothetical protein GCM10010912_46630 [Paenibacillus albidus]|uniref:Resolvase/invertase-type recombinase catalytic domain-containing protein n=1 Tax=Paenibacillus albidus TaxID=2041023 RepID=A0A917FNW7_9BACL|nr:recombinase family protein [Paenibacillus albidus]GGF96464.1 hypothetical protein GCM10010912_46630 [Paenibacillus albidus]
MRCAIYARVSTGLDSQKDSLESQVSFFENYIKEKGWELADVYADEGITGTSTSQHHELKRLMSDAERGMFDVVFYGFFKSNVRTKDRQYMRGLL